MPSYAASDAICDHAVGDHEGGYALPTGTSRSARTPEANSVVPTSRRSSGSAWHGTRDVRYL